MVRLEPSKVIEGLNIAGTVLRPYLEPDGPGILDEARSEVQASHDAYRQRVHRGRAGSQAEEWGYHIWPGRPLSFRPFDINGAHLQIDLFCEIKWKRPGELPCRQSLVMRVWSRNPSVFFRDGIDSKDLRDSEPERRVMLRYHFDLGNEGQPGPRYHVQAGGKAEDCELCWLHTAVDVPRMPFHPMDIILGCEMATTSFLDDGLRLALQDAKWLRALSSSQKHLLSAYYRTCFRHLEHGTDSLLKCLWNGTTY